MDNAIRFQAKLLRRSWRHITQMIRYQRLSLSDVPILFANSFPKSGTHLLTQVLEGFTELGPVVNSGLPAITTFNGWTGGLRSTQEILADLKRLQPADIAYGHLHALQEVRDFICRDGFAPFFILRDPRDVVISHVHYVTDMEQNHVHHHYYAQELHSFEERVKVSISGRPELGSDFPGIAERFKPYLEWIQCPDVMVLRYETFLQEREQTLKDIIHFVVKRGLNLGKKNAEIFQIEDAVHILERFINPSRSPTFRQGKVNAWRDEFSQQNKQLFKEVAGDLLIDLGYEENNDW